MHVVIAGGGTGGHLFPGMAIAEAVRTLHPDARVTFVGTPRGIEVTAVPKAGWDLELIDVAPLKGRSMLQRVTGGFKMLKGLRQAQRLLTRLQPDWVVGVGGYAAAAMTCAAAFRGVPTLIHEQNSIPGLTNRLLGRVVKRVCITFPESASYFPPHKVVLTGNPVRQLVKDGLLAAAPVVASSGDFVVFVFGGSQGARSLNQGMLAALPYLKQLSRPLRIIHQIGAQADEAQMSAAYKAAGVKAEVQRFIHDMGNCYRQADVVLCRAGASSLAELALLGKPAILVPYPFAADNHQEGNARSFVSAGAARMILDHELNGPRLAGELKGVLEDRMSLNAMAACMKKLATPKAALHIVQQAEGLQHV